MATSNVPRHDFAPSWLKIPSQENLKSSPSCKRQVGQSDRHVRQRREETGGENSNGQTPVSNRYNSESLKLHRQSSFENYYDNKHYFSGQTKSSHSVDGDHSYSYGPYGNYYNGYSSVYEKYDMQYNFQPPLLRSHTRQESGKYQQPVSHFNSPVNSGFSNYYYDSYPQEYYHGDVYYSTFETRPASSYKTLSEKDGQLENAKGDGLASKERDSIENPNKNTCAEESVFNNDFPFLHERDDIYDPSGYMTSNGNSVWDNSVLAKSESLFTRNDIDYQTYSMDQESDSPHPVDDIYKYFPPAENYVCNSPQELVNGIDLLSMKDNSTSLLSSSLEAEQRLLREMGWNETEEEYIITEDDKKEFQKLTNQAKHQKNCLVRHLPKTWSPKHMPVYQPNVQDLNDVSSSESDSDDPC
ncbi:1 isoform X2 [Octopus vulgaris]|uniref:1 isoform X2 n=1 Tax=Octopus vulgaris TaxID=6645 RepID=A0AA36B300_OCTVU|nr:1 isoform X2 [Octopus vulgaris]